MNNTPSFSDLEIVKNEYSNRGYEVNISIPEFNCLCPRTGLPDFATIYINYIPNKYIVELKSLKLYVVKYRNIGIFHENVNITIDFGLYVRQRENNSNSNGFLMDSHVRLLQNVILA